MVCSVCATPLWVYTILPPLRLVLYAVRLQFQGNRNVNCYLFVMFVLYLIMFVHWTTWRSKQRRKTALNKYLIEFEKVFSEHTAWELSLLFVFINQHAIWCLHSASHEKIRILSPPPLWSILSSGPAMQFAKTYTDFVLVLLWFFIDWVEGVWSIHTQYRTINLQADT